MNKQKLPSCEMCGDNWINETEDITGDMESIKENKRCIACQEEYGDGWADR